MLKKEAMAKKAARFIINDVMGTVDDKALKNRIINSLEQLYVAGFDLSISECRKDNSRAGEIAADFLETLEEGQNEPSTEPRQ